ncbi:MAG: hypothetical protein M1837_000931 [Sclerophora amabilis]|nr:MAG: hypothetical protein M1837_000931 [Sclerophora amabilis]
MLLYLPVFVALSAVIHAEQPIEPVSIGQQAPDWHDVPEPNPQMQFRNGQCYTIDKGKNVIDEERTAGCCQPEGQPDSARFYDYNTFLETLFTDLEKYNEHCAINEDEKEDFLDAAEFAKCCGADFFSGLCCKNPQHPAPPSDDIPGQPRPAPFVCQDPDPMAPGHIPSEWGHDCDGKVSVISGAFLYSDEKSQAYINTLDASGWKYERVANMTRKPSKSYMRGYR